jgi:tetratricopeptide (TPR) repeat protein
MLEEDLPQAISHLEEALKISEEIKDILSLVMANYWLSFVLQYNCEFKKAIHHVNISLDINRAANSLWGISAMQSTMSHWYFMEGNINLAYQISNEAIQMAEESGDIYSKALAYTSHGVSCYSKGSLEEAINYLSKGNDFCERVKLYGWSGIAQLIWGQLCFDIGEYQGSMNHHFKANSVGERLRISHSTLANHNKLGAFRAQVMTGDKDIDLQTLLDYIPLIKIKTCEGFMRRCIGEILMNLDKQVNLEAEHWIQEAIEADTRNGMRWYLGRDYALYAELFRKEGDHSKAKENLSKAIEILKECGADGWVAKYEKELAAIS